ncbi:phage tail tape measure protein [Gluconobacter japonicus]|uniref:phage tail tape measure protein n=1 Tax=Gluconobacter japonicus TaxID=376620 RepID=UPI003D2C5B08
MSGTLTAQFELTLLDQLSGPIEKIEQLVGRLTSSLDRLGQNSAFDSVWEPVPRCAEQTDVLSEAMSRATGSADILGEGLGVTAATATEAGSALERTAMGATVLEESLARTRIGTSEAVTGLEAVTAAAERTTRAVEQVPQIGGGRRRSSEDEEEPSGRSRYGRRVMDAAGHFHESVERGVGQAFGAAAAGFGLVEPVKAAAEYDNTIRHIGIGLDLHGAANDAFAAAFATQMDRLARDTGQRGEDLAEGAGFFSREGYSKTRLDAVMPVVAHIATAYNAAPDAVAKSTFALQENMGISDQQLGGALASVALAGKSADLPFEKLAPLLPEVAAAAGALGVHGRSGVDDLAAALAVVRKSTGTEGIATTDTRAFIQAITSPHTAKRFQHFGVDLFGLEDHARRHGEDPMLEVLRAVDRITHRGQDRRAVGTLFNNEQDRGFVQAILMHMDQYEEIHRRTSGANQSVIDRDFETGIKTLKIQTTSFDESWEQLERRLGIGFAPILHSVTVGFHGLTEAMEGSDKHLPGLTTGLLGLAGGSLAAVAGLGAVGAISGPVSAGFGLVTAALGVTTAAAVATVSSIAIVGVALAAVGYGIYHNWDHIKAGFTTFEHWISGWEDRVSGSISGAFTHMDPKMPGSPTIRGPLTVPTTGPGWHGLPAHQPLEVHVTHAPGLAVHAAPHLHVKTTVLPSGGRMMNRP